MIGNALVRFGESDEASQAAVEPLQMTGFPAGVARAALARQCARMERTALKDNGLAMAVAAYLMWGLLPLYLQLLKHVPALELLGWRIVFTLPVCLAVLARRGELRALGTALVTKRTVLPLLGSALFIGLNWLIFLVAVAEDHVMATSLGYYINPLVSVLFGVVLLGERLSPRQWAAVAIAGAGIAVLATGALGTLAISLSLAFSFALYGLFRKKIEVGAVVGLTVETAVLFPAAVALVVWYALQPAGSAVSGQPLTALEMFGSGVVTAIPLMLFAGAARRLDLSMLGFIQFLSPTITFVVSLMLGETLDPLKLASFVLIWLAIAVFSWDLWAARRRRLAA